MVNNHSPDGFNIGYGGSGAAQLALGILLEFTDAQTADRLHQAFKEAFLMKPEYFTLQVVRMEIDVRAWIEAHTDPVIGEPMTWDELADEYDRAHDGRRARRLEMDVVFNWAESQVKKFRVDPKDGTIHRVLNGQE